LILCEAAFSPNTAYFSIRPLQGSLASAWQAARRLLTGAHLPTRRRVGNRAFRLHLAGISGSVRFVSRKYRSDAIAAIHETLEALHDVGAVDKQTMRRFDDACLTPIRPLSLQEIKAIRERENTSAKRFSQTT
jgi:hypothetical protein